MRILYAIQGTGNGHISRARDIIPVLEQFCQVDILVSGTQADVNLDQKITYQFKGLGFIFGRHGGVDIINTIKKSDFKNFRKEIKSLPVQQYDFVINDFEPVSAWACYKNKIPCVSLSHQSAVLHKNAPKPSSKDPIGKFILKNYAPSMMTFGFHFKAYADNIFTPVIRKQVRDFETENLGHITVYLPSYDDDVLIKHLSNFPNTKWEVFTKHSKTPHSHNNIIFYPIENEAFIKSMATSEGVLCGAGFETPAEALYLEKKLMVIPMFNQYEQLCNAAALKDMGVPVIKKLKKKYYPKIDQWLQNEQVISVYYPDITAKIITGIFENHVESILKKNDWHKNYKGTLKKLEEILLNYNAS